MIAEWVDWDDGLSEEEAIAIGLWNNPAYQELLADLQITRADIIQAAQLQNPQVTTMFPLGPKQWEFACWSRWTCCGCVRSEWRRPNWSRTGLRNVWSRTD